MKADEQCKECQFFWKPDQKLPAANAGYCRRYPPALAGATMLNTQVSTTGWCGEFKLKEKING